MNFTQLRETVYHKSPADIDKLLGLPDETILSLEIGAMDVRELTLAQVDAFRQKLQLSFDWLTTQAFKSGKKGKTTVTLR